MKGVVSAFCLCGAGAAPTIAAREDPPASAGGLGINLEGAVMSVGTTQQNVIVGAGRFRYEALARWEQLPPGWRFGEVAGVATDSRDRVYVFSRSEHPVTV